MIRLLKGNGSFKPTSSKTEPQTGLSLNLGLFPGHPSAPFLIKKGR